MRQILRELKVVEGKTGDVEFEFECKDDKWYLCGVMPYRDFEEDEIEEEDE